METPLESPPDPGVEAASTETPRGRLGLAEIVFVGLLVATVVAYVLQTRGYTFSTDDWIFAQRGHSLADYFRPYNLSLAVVPIAVYRLLLAVVGFHSTLPLRLVGIVCETSVAVALFLTVRSRVSAAVALVVGATFLWYPNTVLYPSAFDHYLGVTAAIGCAWILTRRRPSQDLLLALALCVSLGASGVGVAAGVGCLVYLAIGGAPWRRWLAVMAPLAAWALWWLTVAHTPRDAAQRTAAQSRDLVVNGIIRSFDGLVGGNRVLGGMLMVVFAGSLAWAVARGARSVHGRPLGAVVAGLRSADHQLAWTAALVAWWVGLAYSRGRFAFPGVFRYQFLGSALVVLAFLPSRRPARIADRLGGRDATVLAIVASLLILAVNHSGITRQSRLMTVESDRIRANMVQVNLGPATVPDTARVGLGPGDNPTLSAGLYRRLVGQLGTPPRTRPGDPDATVLALVPTRLVAVDDDPAARCITVPDSITVGGGDTIRLRAQDAPVDVDVRRFDAGWTRLGTIAGGHTVELRLPAGPSPRAWTVRADGACRVVPGKG